MATAKETEDNKPRIASVPNFRFFLTMNPGYAGRTSIPDGCGFPLEWIVPMTVPPYKDILHIMLATEGYYQAKTLGFKLVDCMESLKETAKENKMHHLDFGLRAAK